MVYRLSIIVLRQQFFAECRIFSVLSQLLQLLQVVSYC